MEDQEIHRSIRDPASAVAHVGFKPEVIFTVLIRDGEIHTRELVTVGNDLKGFELHIHLFVIGRRRIDKIRGFIGFLNVRELQIASRRGNDGIESLELLGFRIVHPQVVFEVVRQQSGSASHGTGDFHTGDLIEGLICFPVISGFQIVVGLNIDIYIGSNRDLVLFHTLIFSRRNRRRYRCRTDQRFDCWDSGRHGRRDAASALRCLGREHPTVGRRA